MWRALVAAVLALCVAAPAAAHLDLLIGREEVMKLLGLDAELYYVRGGVVNSYAISFVVPVPAHVTDLHFTWQSLASAPLPYVMGIEYESRGVMLPPQVNISERGLVPTVPETFRVRLPCSGVRSAEVPVRLHVNVSGADPRRRDVVLLFKRNKICLKGVGWSRERAGGEAARAGEGAPRAGGVLYAAGACAAAALALLAAGAGAAALYSRPSKHNHHDINSSYTTTACGSQADVVLRLAPVAARPPGGPPSGPPTTPPSAAGSYATIASLHKFPFGSRRSPSPYATTHISEPVYTAPESRVSYYAASNLTHVSQHSAEARLHALSTPRAALRLERLEHEGVFGQVYRGLWSRGGTCLEVLVKTVTEGASERQAALLVCEGLRLHALQHTNVVAPAAACLLPARAPLLVYPCAAHEHNLKRYLCECGGGARAAPAARELAALAAHAACALAYLHAQRLLHADLAARNCLVDEKLRLKVTDNALSRDLFPEDYHCLGDGESRPVKWMAPETLLQGNYSTASDVWSLGVLVWELVTLGGAPLAELDAADVGACLAAGYRPRQPHTCPDHLYGLMAWCWAGGVHARPSAPQLLAALHDFRSVRDGATGRGSNTNQ